MRGYWVQIELQASKWVKLSGYKRRFLSKIDQITLSGCEANSFLDFFKNIRNE